MTRTTLVPTTRIRALVLGRMRVPLCRDKCLAEQELSVFRQRVTRSRSWFTRPRITITSGSLSMTRSPTGGCADESQWRRRPALQPTVEVLDSILARRAQFHPQTVQLPRPPRNSGLRPIEARSGISNWLQQNLPDAPREKASQCDTAFNYQRPNDPPDGTFHCGEVLIHRQRFQCGMPISSACAAFAGMRCRSPIGHSLPCDHQFASFSASGHSTSFFTAE